MEALSKKLDFLTRHWAPYPRRFPARFPLASMGYYSAKNHRVRHAFSTCNFSLILKGAGTFVRAGRTWTVTAPCVITQWPGEHLDYGPEVPGETWEEVYLIYNRRLFAGFRAARLIDPGVPVWPIADAEVVRSHLEELAALSRSTEPAVVVDHVDRVSERILLATWSPSRLRGAETPVHLAAAAMRCDLASAPDVAGWALAHGLSPTTFRRRWHETFGTPPARYLRELRIAEARRLVVETSLRIHEIAARCGFEDEFYFSRSFRQATGMAPRDYRKMFRPVPQE